MMGFFVGIPIPLIGPIVGSLLFGSFGAMAGAMLANGATAAAGRKASRRAKPLSGAAFGTAAKMGVGLLMIFADGVWFDLLIACELNLHEQSLRSRTRVRRPCVLPAVQLAGDCSSPSHAQCAHPTGVSHEDAGRGLVLQLPRCEVAYFNEFEEIVTADHFYFTVYPKDFNARSACLA